MTLRELVPDAIKSHLKLLARKRQFRECTIDSARVSKDAVLGRGVTICRDAEIGSGVRIGDYSYLNAGTVIASGAIGKFCSIGYFCQIGLPEHPLAYISTSPRTYGPRNIFSAPCRWDDYPNPPEIGNDVWIASHVVILQGIRIADGAVVGAGSVVTRDVEPYTIVCGVPARPVRARFSEEEIRILLDLRWWDQSEDELRRQGWQFGTANPDWDAIRRQVTVSCGRDECGAPGTQAGGRWGAGVR